MNVNGICLDSGVPGSCDKCVALPANGSHRAVMAVPTP